MSKLTSRKFWVSVAAFLASIGTSITGLAVQDPTIATAGIICSVLSAAIYAASEAYVDAASASANGTSKTVTATSTSASIVQAALQPTINEETKKAEQDTKKTS